MERDEQSLADKARDLGIDDTSFLRALEKTEGAAKAKSMAVIRNGEFPYWSVERYVLIAGVITTVMLNTFDVGGRWERIENRVATSAADVEQVQRTLAAVQTDVLTIRLEQTRVRTELDIDAGRKRPETPVFERGLTSR